VPTSAVADLSAARPARQTGLDQARLSRPVRLGTRWPEGSTIATRCRRPRSNLSGKYLCTADLRGWILRRLLGWLACISSGADRAEPFSRHFSFVAEGPGGGLVLPEP